MATEAEIQEIKDRLDISNIIGRSVTLKKSGSNFVGLCPFHNEKTPSFYVHPNDGYFKCFGCGVGGDVYRFQEMITGAGFADVLKNLAEEAGVEIKKQHYSSQQIEKQRRKKESLALMQTCLIFFKNCLQNSKKGAQARKYLNSKRKLNLEIWEHFSLGFGGMDDEELLSFLKEDFKSLQLAKELSVLKSGERGYYNFFKKRIIFPIRSTRGEVVAFGGRVFFESDHKKAKYINGAQSELYDKSLILYGLFEAMPALKKNVPAVLVEGYFDVIATHRCDLKTGVAPCGTSLTTAQVVLLGKYTKEVIICMDNDRAGKIAKEKATLLFLSHGFKVRECFLEAKDPDECIKEKGEVALSVALHSAKDVLDNRFEELKKTAAFESASAISQKANEFWVYIDALPKDSFIRSQYVTKAAKLLHFKEKDLEKTLNVQPEKSFKKKDIKIPVIEQKTNIAEKEFNLDDLNRSNIEASFDEHFVAEEHFEHTEITSVPKSFGVRTVNKNAGSLNQVEKIILDCLIAQPEIIADVSLILQLIKNKDLITFIKAMRKALITYTDTQPKDILQKMFISKKFLRQIFEIYPAGLATAHEKFTFLEAKEIIQDCAFQLEIQLLKTELNSVVKVLKDITSFDHDFQLTLTQKSHELSQRLILKNKEYKEYKEVKDSFEEVENNESHQLLTYFSDLIVAKDTVKEVEIVTEEQNAAVVEVIVAAQEKVDLPWEVVDSSPPSPPSETESFFDTPRFSTKKDALNEEKPKDFNKYDIEDEFLW